MRQFAKSCRESDSPPAPVWHTPPKPKLRQHQPLTSSPLQPDAVDEFMELSAEVSPINSLFLLQSIFNQMSSSRHSSRSRENHRPDYRRQERSYDKPPKSSKLFVTNIDSKYDEEQLRKELTDSFSKYGDIKDIVIKTKLGSLNSYAFIEFNSIQEAQKAIQALNKAEFLGKELKVEFGRGPKNRRMYCYTCHRDGHLARDCPDNRKGYHHKRDRSRSNQGRRYGGRSKSRSRSDRRRYRRSRTRSGERRPKDERDKRERDYERRRYEDSRSGSPRRQRYETKRRYSRDRSVDRNNR